MKSYRTPMRTLFILLNYTAVVLLCLLCLFPLLHILALSLSASSYVATGGVTLWPRGFNLTAYDYVLNNEKFWHAFAVTGQRLLLGIPLNLLLVILMAYPLSKEEEAFPARRFYMAAFMVVMIFNGGLVPTYLLVQQLGLLDTIWALVLPCGMNVFNAVIMMNFFRGIPKEIEESAIMDGANQLQVLLFMYLPLAVPCIATITLFSFMGHWNAWQDGRIYMNFSSNYPLQTYLQSIMQNTDDILGNLSPAMMRVYMELSSRNLRAAQIVVSTVPVLLIYPLLQRYFTSGLVMGSVKG